MFLTVDNLCKEHPGGPNHTPLLSDISFTLGKGEICVAVGSSESSRSALFNIIGGLDRASSGQLHVNSKNITTLTNKQQLLYRRNDVGYVFPSPDLFPTLSVAENIQIASDITKSPLPLSDLLEETGLQDKANALPCTLTGCEQRKVSIARAVVKKPTLLLCDTPTAFMDLQSAKQIIALLVHVNQSYGITILLTSNNTMPNPIADKLIRLRPGKTAEIKSVSPEEKTPFHKIEW